MAFRVLTKINSEITVNSVVKCIEKCYLSVSANTITKTAEQLESNDANNKNQSLSSQEAEENFSRNHHQKLTNNSPQNQQAIANPAFSVKRKTIEELTRGYRPKKINEVEGEEEAIENQSVSSDSGQKTLQTDKNFEFKPSKTCANAIYPLRPLRLASPFPEPVKIMPSNQISDKEKADAMFAEAKQMQHVWDSNVGEGGGGSMMPKSQGSNGKYTENGQNFKPLSAASHGRRTKSATQICQKENQQQLLRADNSVVNGVNKLRRHFSTSALSWLKKNVQQIVKPLQMLSIPLRHTKSATATFDSQQKKSTGSSTDWILKPRRYFSTTKIELKNKDCDRGRKQCPDTNMPNCPPRHDFDCNRDARKFDCKKQEAPYPAYSEFCHTELEESTSECKICPWRSDPNFMPPKKRFHIWSRSRTSNDDSAITDTSEGQNVEKTMTTLDTNNLKEISHVEKDEKIGNLIDKPSELATKMSTAEANAKRIAANSSANFSTQQNTGLRQQKVQQYPKQQQSQIQSSKIKKNINTKTSESSSGNKVNKIQSQKINSATAATKNIRPSLIEKRVKSKVEDKKDKNIKIMEEMKKLDEMKELEREIKNEQKTNELRESMRMHMTQLREISARTKKIKEENLKASVKQNADLEIDKPPLSRSEMIELIRTNYKLKYHMTSNKRESRISEKPMMSVPEIDSRLFMASDSNDYHKQSAGFRKFDNSCKPILDIKQ